MKKFLVVTQLFGVSLFVFGCGTSDPVNNDSGDGAANSQCTVQESPDGEQSVIRCDDGSTAIIKNGRTGFKGEDGKDGEPGQDGMDGEKGEKGDAGDKGDPGMDGQDGMDGIDGKSVDIQERMLPQGDPNCPNGGKAIEFYVEGEMTPRATSYQCNADAGGCGPGTRLDAALGTCISWAEVQFTGVVSDTVGLSNFPAAMQPANITTSQQNPAQATTCSGTLTYPRGMAPTASSSTFGAFSAEYVFGHVNAYGVEVTIDNVTYQRDARFSVPGSVLHMRNYLPLMPGGELSVSSTASPLQGFEPEASTRVAVGGFRMLGANDSFSMSLPTSAADWSLLTNPGVTIEYIDANFINTSTITCEITQFIDP